MNSSQQTSRDHLALLYQLSQTFNSSLDLDEVLNRVMDEVIAATRAERGFIMLREPDGELAFRTARGMARETIDEPEFQISRGVVEKAAHEGEPILTSDAQHDPRFSGRESVLGLKLRSILCVPLKLKEAVSGVIYVDNRIQAGIFTEDDLNLLNAIAASAAIAIENARLFQIAVEKGRMERELEMAYKVQSSLIPGEIPKISGWQVAATWVPAREVAGDFYDFFPGKEGQWGLVIADVVDKGMAAALFMANSRSILRASVRGGALPKEAITEANRLVCADAAYGMFLSLVYTVLYPDSGELIYVNAGHNPPLLCRAGEKEPQELTRTGSLVGVFDDAVYEQRTLHLEQGDFIVFYTDGVIDAINPQEQLFGEQRFREVVQENCELPPEELLAAIQRAVNAFTGSEAPFDDITLMVVKRD
jgi:sigma-B regulation protein RsbU (phosphoserine phosphatase)